MACVDEEFNIHRYLWHFIESPSEDDFCYLCKKILKEPMLTECCGNHLCRACAEPSIASKKLLQCPSCEQYSVMCILDKAKWRHVLELKISCPLQERGCEWTGEIQRSDEHLMLGCEYMDFECSNGCGESLERHEIAEHLKKFCPKRKVSCEYCKEVGTLELMVGDHLLKCPSYSVICPYGCGDRFKQVLSEQHSKECSHMAVSCPYRFAGCDVTFARRMMQQHLEEDIHRHSHLQSKYFHEELSKKSHEFTQQKDVSDRLYEYYDELRQVSASKIEFSSKLLLEQIVVESTQTLDKGVRKINQSLTELKHRLEWSHEHMEHTVKRLVCQMPSKLWEVDPKELQFASKLASGQFSEVWKGLQYGEKQVAIKKHKSGSMTSSKFLQEARALRDLEHDNILTLLGVCTSEEPILLITEYMTHGNLLDFLKNAGKAISLSQQVSIIQQIASGLAHLENMNCIHRAVNSRSILVGDNLQCKIGSFTLAKMLEEGKTEYNIPQGERVPIKWSAPEVLIHNKCSTKSDMWSFGVVQYEVITLKGLKMSNSMAEVFIKTRSKIEQPQGCPELLHKLVVQCLEKDPDSRPSFALYLDKLQNLRH